MSGSIGRGRLGLAVAAALLVSPAFAGKSHIERVTPRSQCLDQCSVDYYNDLADCVSRPPDVRKDCHDDASVSRKTCRAGCPTSAHSSRRR